jgi:hypothetical protein
LTLTSNYLDQQSLQKEPDRQSPALVGAVSGLIAGSAYELGEAIFHHANEMESFLQIILEVGAATLAGSFMFAVFSTIRNRLK